MRTREPLKPLPYDYRPFADLTRAAEIALMDEFGLEEFTELTGVGAGVCSIFRVAPTGIWIWATENLAKLTPTEQIVTHRLAKVLTLGFPCTPAQFLKWYGEVHNNGLAWAAEPHPAMPIESGWRGIPIAEGFTEALNLQEGVPTPVLSDSVPSQMIVEAFRVKSDPAENAKWWDDRMRHAVRYKMRDARASRGRAGVPARWYPLQIAAWLIDKSHSSPERVRRAIEAHFPKVDSTLV